jgi:hypothetical protein
MNQGKYVFSQLVEHLPQRLFDKYVERYQGNYRVRHYTCWNQMLCMMFGQLSGRESLRDLLVSINAHKPKFYHLGLGKNVSRSNLANANEKRDYRIFEEFAYELIRIARIECLKDAELELSVENNVYALDSTLIGLCLSIFWWAKYRKTTARIKIHTLYDIKTSIPCFIRITDGLVHDMNELDWITFEPGGFYVMDRGYMDFQRLYRIHQHSAFFVTRARENLKIKLVGTRKLEKSTGVLSDQHVRLILYYSSKRYPDTLRRIKYLDAEKNRILIFLTNNFELDAEQIALLYKYRWKIELFFKWIKQHLKIKTFWGVSMNAVKTQVYIAIITYTLVALVKSKLKLTLSTYEILQILSVSLLDKTPLNELLTNSVFQDVKEQNDIQLKINFF